MTHSVPIVLTLPLCLSASLSLSLLQSPSPFRYLVLEIITVYLSQRTHQHTQHKKISFFSLYLRRRPHAWHRDSECSMAQSYPNRNTLIRYTVSKILLCVILYGVIRSWETYIGTSICICILNSKISSPNSQYWSSENLEISAWNASHIHQQPHIAAESAVSAAKSNEHRQPGQVAVVDTGIVGGIRVVA